LVVHVHATEFDRSGKQINQPIFELEHTGMKLADKIIAVSHLTRNVIIEKYGISPQKVHTIHNAVLPLEKEKEQVHERYLKEKIVTYLGRVTYQKGPEYFIEAAYKVLQKEKNVRFVMAGSGDLLHKMVKRVAELRISSHFHFTGFLKGKEVEQMFALSDVYVMPSVSEPFGIAPLEAMRSNVPVIVSRQSGVAEVLQHALKVDFWDINGLADAIYGLLRYQALSKTFSNFGKLEVDNLKWESVAAKVNQIYYEIMPQS
jgi:glycosyltransferase involved in cell wall biosynthesis